jgi:hypothetical protein
MIEADSVLSTPPPSTSKIHTDDEIEGMSWGRLPLGGAIRPP